MTARIKRFYTRAELGMKPPTAVSHNITPQNGGAAGHYGGGGPNPPPSTFEAAKRIWLGWQAYHMNSKGWRDIAYTAGYDNLGNVYAGRGLNVRSGANGSNFGNQNYYAFVWIGGGSAVPSQAAKDAYEWLVYWARTKGNAGKRSRPHSDFTSTSCAGSQLSPFIRSLDNKSITLPTTPVVKPPVLTDKDELMALTVENPNTGQPWPLERALWSIWSYSFQAAKAAQEAKAIAEAVAKKVDLDPAELTEIRRVVAEEIAAAAALEPDSPV